jgi:hypothetical protein
MTRYERAAQIWPVLTLCAANRQVLTYDLLSKLVGVPRQGLGQLLEPVQSWCIKYDNPALTSLVVSDKSGLPGEGFIGAADVPAEQASVFRFPWLESSPPTAAELEAAAREYPSNGKSLAELKAKRAS